MRRLSTILMAPAAAVAAWAYRAKMPAARKTLVAAAARRYASGAAVIDGKIYVPGGLDGSGHMHKTLLAYDPVSNTWQQRADLPVLSAGGVSAAIGGKLYVFTPWNQSTGGHSRLHRYDPAGNSWTELAMPPLQHDAGVGGAIDGKFYVVGGHTSNGASAVLDVYHPATDTWTTKAPMSTPTPGRRPPGGFYGNG